MNTNLIRSMMNSEANMEGTIRAYFYGDFKKITLKKQFLRYTIMSDASMSVFKQRGCQVRILFLLRQIYAFPYHCKEKSAFEAAKINKIL